MSNKKLSVAKPGRRPLKIFAFDPQEGRIPENRISIDVPNEELKSGPAGSRLIVIDYDATRDKYYVPIDLDDPNVLVQGGLDPSESDPRFHQQMVYAVASKVLEHFDIGLGRRFTFTGGKRLRLFPHAFEGANAFYERSTHSIYFGYFRASRKNFGTNIPGQAVFNCLSQDVIAHEVTHAVLDRLKPNFLHASNPDVAAFHEAFADIVAILQHFSFPSVLKDHIQKQRAKLDQPGPLVELAQQFGYSTGQNQALRTAISKPKSVDYQKEIESHKRGSILVAAVFDSFFQSYQSRIKDLVRIATGGSGLLPQGDLHPDLIKMIAKEAANAAQSVLNMCIRAIDYLPPVDVTFGDFLRALVTSDIEITQGSDEYGQRHGLIEGFRSRGIYPDGAFSLAEDSLRWPQVDAGTLPPLNIEEQLAVIVLREAAKWQTATDKEHSGRKIAEEKYQASEEKNTWKSTAPYLHKYAEENCLALQLDPNIEIEVAGFHPTFRISKTGQYLAELVVQYVQSEEVEQGPPIQGGTTLICSSDGTVKYVISKPLPHNGLGIAENNFALRRIENQNKYLEFCINHSVLAEWLPHDTVRSLIPKTLNLSSLHSKNWQVGGGWFDE